MIQEQLRAVEQLIQEACLQSHRPIEEVTLIAVSKTQPIEVLQEAYDAGVRHFGENKVQELIQKFDVLPNDIVWHMIGHLQTNKVKQVVGKAALIHSVDSLRLAKEIDKESKKKGCISHILLEVNVAEEESKFGFSLDEVLPICRELSTFDGIMVDGLMTIAPFVEKADENRIIFEKLHKLLVDINKEKIDNISMKVLSMGMTNDYIVAIEEGATMVRVGTGIFGARNYHH